MKSTIVFTILFQILSGSSVVSFQTSAPIATPLVFPQREAKFFHATTPEPSRRLPLLASTITADSAVAAEVAGPALANPWERVCSTVQTTTEQLNDLRQKIAKSGVATALSYSLVSNAFTSVAVSLAWYGFNVQVCERSVLVAGFLIGKK